MKTVRSEALARTSPMLLVKISPAEPEIRRFESFCRLRRQTASMPSSEK